MLRPRNLSRLSHVASVFIRHGFEDVLDNFGLLRFFGRRRRRARKPAERDRERARKLRIAFEELGATYVKLGQLLSGRPDLLPEVFIEELSRLQDRVEPVGFELVRERLEEELGGPLDRHFASFDRKPVAAASLAQVYRAELRETPPDLETKLVAVKVLKPGVRELVESDCEILREVAERLQRSGLGELYNFEALASQLETTLLAELDLTREAINARRLLASMEEFPLIKVPAVVTGLSTKTVLVLEYIEGTRVADAQVQSPELASELWRAYLKQILVDGAFHCDPHAGNFLIDDEGRLALLDHGMIAYLSNENQLRLMALLVSLVEGDGERAARAAVELGVPGKDFREPRFRAEVGVLVARYSGATLQEIAFGQLVREILNLCFRHGIQIAPEMVLLGKTLLNLEPLCRRFDPNLDPVRTMQDMASRLLEEQLTRDVSRERFMAALLELRAILYEVPPGFRRLVARASNNELRLGIEIEKADQMRTAVRDVANRVTLGLITASLIVGSALLLNVDAGPTIYGYPLFALIGFLLAAGLGIYVVAKILWFNDG